MYLYVLYLRCKDTTFISNTNIIKMKNRIFSIIFTSKSIIFHTIICIYSSKYIIINTVKSKTSNIKIYNYKFCTTYFISIPPK